MSASDHVRHYVVLKTTPELWAEYRERRIGFVHEYIATHAGAPALIKRFEVAGLPSNDVAAAALDKSADATAPPETGANGGAGEPPSELVAALRVEAGVAAEFQEAVRSKPDVFVGGGADLPFSGADHWCPREAADPIFGDRAEAERLLALPAFRKKRKLTGSGVNVVIVDQGLDGQALGRSFGGGWTVHSTAPGTARAPSAATRLHAMMVAHNVLGVAPDALLFDLPMVPPRIIDIAGFFLSTADAAYRLMLGDIRLRRLGTPEPAPWVIANAWAIYDRSGENPPGSYTDSPSHPFNQLITRAGQEGIDFVFCAGNCGQFCPDQRCGALDQGPGRSIFGANCHPDVLSVGAVRTDTLWLGYSSQGPGQPGFWPGGKEKPDLCAPSQFCENDDAHATNGGSSAASGLAAGVIAALRSHRKWQAPRASPAQLRAALTKSARKTDGSAWSRRLGHGILDAEKAADELAGQFP